MQQHQRDKIPWILTAIILWCVIIVMLIKVDPQILENVFLPHLFIPLVLLVFAAITTTVATIRCSLTKGLVWGAAGAIYLELRLLELGNILNFLLIISLLITLEYYWWTLKQKSPQI